jgi:hypothetical protein
MFGSRRISGGLTRGNGELWIVHDRAPSFGRCNVLEPTEASSSRQQRMVDEIEQDGIERLSSWSEMHW